MDDLLGSGKNIFSSAGATMSARKRKKMNKAGQLRLPPNLKGLPSIAKGGLGGAAVRPRKYAEGGLVVGDVMGDDYEDDAPAGVGLGSDVGAVNALYASSGDHIRRAKEMAMKRLDMPPQANLGLLQFAAGMMSPTKTGSFGENLGYGIKGYAEAEADRRKQLSRDASSMADLEFKSGSDLGELDYRYANILKDMEESKLNRIQREELAHRRLEVMKAKAAGGGGSSNSAKPTAFESKVNYLVGLGYDQEQAVKMALGDKGSDSQKTKRDFVQKMVEGGSDVDSALEAFDKLEAAVGGDSDPKQSSNDKLDPKIADEVRTINDKKHYRFGNEWYVE